MHSWVGKMVDEEGGSDTGASLQELFYGAATVGERGQVVIPSEARRQCGIQHGDKLLVFRHPHLRGVVLARVDDVQTMLGEMRRWADVVLAASDEAEAAK